MMMTTDLRIPCFDSEIIVKRTGEEEEAFIVSIQGTKNPLAFGNELGSFMTEEQAIRSANKFCAFYSQAREKGYYLKKDAFVKPDYEDISVAQVMGSDSSEEELGSLLRE